MSTGDPTTPRSFQKMTPNGRWDEGCNSRNCAPFTSSTFGIGVFLRENKPRGFYTTFHHFKWYLEKQKYWRILVHNKTCAQKLAFLRIEELKSCLPRKVHWSHVIWVQPSVPLTVDQMVVTGASKIWDNSLMLKDASVPTASIICSSRVGKYRCGCSILLWIKQPFTEN